MGRRIAKGKPVGPREGGGVISYPEHGYDRDSNPTNICTMFVVNILRLCKYLIIGVIVCL